VTGPDMRTPREVAEVAQILRRLVRSTGQVRTGMGAAREDVNVSVRGGTRVEIKGVPRIPRIPLLTYHEAMRQWNLLGLREALRGRGITPETFRAESEDVTRLLVKTSYQPIRDALGAGAVAAAVVLRGFRDLLSWQTQTNTRFSREISDRVRVVACLTQLPNIIHSDSLSETLSSSRWDSVRKAVRATADDTVVVVWGPAEDVKTAVQEIAIRAREAAAGVPSETRQALRDGTNGFERILPGPDRMYPDTDLPPKQVTEERLAAVRLRLPTPVWTREAWYRELGLPADVVEVLSISPLAGFFEMLVKEWRIDPVAAAVAIVQFPKRLKRKGLDPDRLTEEALRPVFAFYRDRRISRDGVWALMETVARGEPLPGIGELHAATEEQIYAQVVASQTALRAMRLHNAGRKAHVLMGLVMTALRGRVEGAAIAERVRAAAEGTC
jgi:glutamyl-tRNA(Gln) amidotransferase subunit E